MSYRIARSSCRCLYGALLSSLALLPLAACSSAIASTPRASRSAEGLTPPSIPADVDVSRTVTGGTLIRIIGGPGGGEPLLVVDGAPVTTLPGRGLDWLDPDQIARIQVLKYPVETAIYGPRGVYGVVLITTRGGK